ncbi:Mitochondrial metalloendopeptidase OMA1 [Camellia lanceoleosa]|uniref:Mitochondrial metalloendopeptidase OMA1 n=1 Tax=Camellia lanceoleosa TaxID=1840588 RepID=A0ACC0H3M7_9ERIC|nr:Mitochondrial metalloendopeptidase OMA1 [Camellia lanceoleosa]
MGWYRRSKLAFETLHPFASKIKPPKKPIRNPTLTSPKSQVSSPISTTLGFQSGFKFKQNQHNPFHAFPRRFYNADRYHVQHFKPRGPRKWCKNPRTVFTVVLLSSGVIITVYFGNLETVPHTNRKHFVLLSRNLEKQIGEAQFKQIKAAFKGKILPAIHPESIRVRLIYQDIIGALHRGLRIGEAWNDLGTDPEIATIIGHEVGHAVARHIAEGITKNIWFVMLQLILFQFIMPDLVYTMSTLFLKLPFSRRMEMEADYIGLLLMASAGYDPQVAPKVYEKLGMITGDSKLRDYLSTHPSGKKRAVLLSQAKVMEEAMAIYREAILGQGVLGFL